MMENPCRINTEIWFLEPDTFFATDLRPLHERKERLSTPHDVIYDVFIVHRKYSSGR